MDNIIQEPWRRQIILGTLLGSSYLQRLPSGSWYLGMTESKDSKWVAYKALELGGVAARKAWSEDEGRIKWRSQGSQLWSGYYEKFYDHGGNRVEMRTLDEMRDIGLAIWFGDRGFWYSSRRIGLRCSKFERSIGIISDYFQEVGIPCSIIRKSIVFTREGTGSFLRTIAHRLPEFMHYRLEKS